MNIKLSVIQFAPVLEAQSKNLAYIEKKSKEINSDIIIFPELASSGYFYSDKEKLRKQAFSKDSDIIKKFQEISTDLNKIIVFGFPELDGDKIYNSSITLFPDALLSRVYRKTHLFYKERFVFDEGNSGYFNIYYPDFDLNIGSMICYDWRFPEAARSLALLGSDLIICPSNLVTGVWDNVCSARALENKVYLAVANRNGNETLSSETLSSETLSSETLNNETLEFNGASAIYDYNGKKLVCASESSDDIITTTINPSETRDKSFNPYNDIFKDRRQKYYLTSNK